MKVYDFPSIQAGARILIVGLGETGLAAARWCLAQGAQLRVLDTRLQPAGLAALQDAAHALEGQVEYGLGETHFTAAALIDVQQLVLSPGLSPLAEPVRSLLDLARQQAVPIVGEIELFAQALRDMREQDYCPAVLAITGTNGKTTVTAMVRELVAACGVSVQAAGNIGPAALTALQTALQQGNLPQVWVLELSSFQLATTQALVPDAAAVLNVSQDHLDWHGDMAAYVACKQALVKMARVAVLNRDDAQCLAMVDDAQALSVRTFGAGLPRWEGDMGVESDHGLEWLCSLESIDDGVPAPAKRRKKEPVPEHRGPGRLSRLMPADALQVSGRHNTLNALAALALGREIGLGWGDMLRALRAYRGEPHRMQRVRHIADISFINDSKATNVGATLAALDGLHHKVVLIAGGVAKGQDFTPLRSVVGQHARAVVLIGQDQHSLAQVLDIDGLEVQHAQTLAQAVRQAHALAHAGDAVLLSPACASLDMFDSYVHRGQVFMDAVQDLALDLGEVA